MILEECSLGATGGYVNIYVGRNIDFAILGCYMPKKIKYRGLWGERPEFFFVNDCFISINGEIIDIKGNKCIDDYYNRREYWVRNEIEVTPTSRQLDRQNFSCSFKNPKTICGKAVRWPVQKRGISNKESNKKIGYPVILDEETAWQFAGRLAEYLGIDIIPDIKTDRIIYSLECE